jgi:3-oxoacyl-[acyl-carrier protein] reductase
MSVAAHEFSGQVVIVTGGAQGIGFGIAELFGKHGAKVALFDMQADKLASAVADLEAKSIEAMHAVVNVAVPEDWKNAVDAVLSKYGRIDVLVQAAGITGKTGIKTHEVDPANYDAVMNVNAKGVFLGCHAVLPSMVKADYGRIVNIASVVHFKT